LLRTPGEKMSAPRSLLDEVLPRLDANGVYELWVPAPPEVVFVALKEVTVREVRFWRLADSGRTERGGTRVPACCETPAACGTHSERDRGGHECVPAAVRLRSWCCSTGGASRVNRPAGIPPGSPPAGGRGCAAGRA
jgi:hypothetical protein